MASLQIVIQSTASGEEYLPVAHTCYNLLDLPKYSSKEILSARLTQALDNYEGFSLAWGSSACPIFPFLPQCPHWDLYRKSWGVISIFLLSKWVGTLKSWAWLMCFWDCIAVNNLFEKLGVGDGVKNWPLYGRCFCLFCFKPNYPVFLALVNVLHSAGWNGSGFLNFHFPNISLSPDLFSQCFLVLLLTSHSSMRMI